MITIKKITNQPIELFKVRIWHKGLCIAESEQAEPYVVAVERAKQWQQETEFPLHIQKLES